MAIPCLPILRTSSNMATGDTASEASKARRRSKPSGPLRELPQATGKLGRELLPPGAPAMPINTVWAGATAWLPSPKTSCMGTIASPAGDS